jgi:hypothetical protein
LEGRRIVVHRERSAGDWTQRLEVSGPQRLTATAVALPPLDVGDVLTAADA